MENYFSIPQLPGLKYIEASLYIQGNGQRQIALLEIQMLVLNGRKSCQSTRKQMCCRWKRTNQKADLLQVEESKSVAGGADGSDPSMK